MNKIKKENLLYRKAIPCSRLFLRKEKTREQAKEVLMLSDSYKSEEDIERELDFRRIRTIIIFCCILPYNSILIRHFIIIKGL